MSGALRPGEVVTLAPGVRRLLAPNPGMMTGPGTNTYLLGEAQIAVLDPGPRIDAHIDAIRAAAAAPIRWILVTHTHPDHSPAALPLAQATGAELLGREPPPQSRQDPTFSPDRLLHDGDRLEFADFSLRALHTPGHASNHLCYLHQQHHWLFTGDHVMNGSTVVIDPPDGNMNEYLRSLARLRTVKLHCLAPGHGDVLGDPQAAIDWIIAHRLEREAKLVRALHLDPRQTLAALLPIVYDDVDPRLLAVAERSLLAHLIKLREDGRVRQAGERWQLVTGS